MLINSKYTAYLKDNLPWVASWGSRIYALLQVFKNYRVYKGSAEVDLGDIELVDIQTGSRLQKNELLQKVEAGGVVVARDLVGAAGLEENFKSFFESRFGIDYADAHKVHDLMPVSELIGKIKNFKDDPELLSYSTTFIRSLFADQKELYVELMPNLRPHLPYRKTLKHLKEIEARVGRGKLTPHGPHKDSWRYHPNNTINVWIALTDVNNLNGMFLLPESRDYYPMFAENEIVPGCHTYPNMQYLTQLKKGDAVIFSAELLHGSVINQTEFTRFALSLRCTTEVPEFHKSFTYNYIQVSPGYSNLGGLKLLSKSSFEPGSTDRHYNKLGEADDRVKVVDKDDRYIHVDVNGEIKRYPRKCPHNKVELADGVLEGDCIVCPQHQLRVRSVD